MLKNGASLLFLSILLIFPTMIKTNNSDQEEHVKSQSLQNGDKTYDERNTFWGGKCVIGNLK